MNSITIAPHVMKMHGASLSIAMHTTNQKLPDQFVTALAHEIRNPLTNITLAVEMLQSEIKDDYMKKSLEIILLSSIQINDLVNQLLKRQQADEAQAEKHSIQQLLDQVIEVAKDHITLKNIKLSKNYAAQDCKIKIMLHKTVQ